MLHTQAPQIPGLWPLSQAKEGVVRGGTTHDSQLVSWLKGGRGKQGP